MAIPSKEKKTTGPKRYDEESETILFNGASLAQISTIFAMDARDVKAKLQGNVEPNGERRGHLIYQLRDVAPYLVVPPYSMDEFIQKMTIADLPMILRKEYWAGMRSRQLFEREAAELWPTSEVVEMLSTLLKTLRLSLLMTRESVERETELTDRQRDIISTIITNALEDAYATTTRQFSAVTAAGSSLAEKLPEGPTGEEDL